MMKRILQWLKDKASAFIAVMVMLLVIESLAGASGVEHAIEPKGKLARLLWVSETARVPLMIGFAIILSPITLGYKIKEKFFRKGIEVKS